MVRTANQIAAANRRPAGQWGGSGNLSAIVATDRAFRAAVAELDRQATTRTSNMYGVPADLPIQRFVGDALFQACIGMDGVHFCFGRAGRIAAHGNWELRDSNGNLVDQALEHSTREYYRLHVILNADVTGYRLDPPDSFSLTFSTGHVLTIIDDSPQYESFAIYPDGIYV
jgi:hypothetical protein